jgi:hypothetical protein
MKGQGMDYHLHLGLLLLGPASLRASINQHYVWMDGMNVCIARTLRFFYGHVHLGMLRSIVERLRRSSVCMNGMDGWLGRV